jgi:hypothetical protein
VKAATIAARAGEAAAAANRVDDAARFTALSTRIGEVGGFGGLNKAERELFGQAAKMVGVVDDARLMRGGVYFRLPGTEGIRIPVLSEVTAPLGRKIAQGTTGIRKSKGWEKLSHPFMTPKREFLKQFSRSDLQTQRNALAALQSTTMSNVVAMRYMEQLKASRSTLLSATSKMGLDGEDLLRYIDDPDAVRVGADGVEMVNPVAARVAAEGREGPTAKLVERWSQWWEQARTQANDILGEDWLARRKNYTFHMRLQLLDDAIDEAATVAADGARGVNRIAPEMRADIAVGRVYRGVKILAANDPQTFALYGARLAPEDQALEILRRQGFGVEVDALFSKDLKKVTEAYVNVVAGRLASRHFAKSLTEAGVAVSNQAYQTFLRRGALGAKARMLQRARFPLLVAEQRAARAAAVAAGAPLPASTPATFLDLVDSVAGSALIGSNLDDTLLKLGAAAKGVSDDLGRVERLGAELDRLMNQFLDETDRLYQAGNLDEVWDVTVVGVSSSTKRIVDRIYQLEDERWRGWRKLKASWPSCSPGCLRTGNRCGMRTRHSLVWCVTRWRGLRLGLLLKQSLMRRLPVWVCWLILSGCRSRCGTCWGCWNGSLPHRTILRLR